MGFALFTQSGTFNPSSYGLSAGDVVHVAAIGGGGGGVKSYTSNINGTQGGTTSFGSVLTCAGGLGAKASNNASASTAPQVQEGAALGGYAPERYTATAWPYYYNNNAGYRQLYEYQGGCGANGFYPGVCRPSNGISGIVLVNLVYGLNFSPQAGYADIFGGKAFVLPTYLDQTTPLLIDHYRSVNVYARNDTSSTWVNMGEAELSPRTDGRGGNAKRYCNTGYFSYVNYSPIGGLGYGAGGASGNRADQNYYNFIGSGGNSGVFKETEYTLTVDSIAVTVGVGGDATGQYGGGSGGGCCGCVAIWW